MLLVNSNSKLDASQFVDVIQKAPCLSKDIKSLFSAQGSELKIERKYKGTRPPAWFPHWHDAAVFACDHDEWELTTGFGLYTNGGSSILIPDGVSTRRQEKDPTGREMPDPEISSDKGGVWGQVVPTEGMARDLAGSKDSLKHYGESIVWSKSKGQTRGAIVVVNRYSIPVASQTIPVSPNSLTNALFHELLHAGKISAGSPYADNDKRFKTVADHVKAQFLGSCAAR